MTNETKSIQKDKITVTVNKTDIQLHQDIVVTTIMLRNLIKLGDFTNLASS